MALSHMLDHLRRPGQPYPSMNSIPWSQVSRQLAVLVILELPDESLGLRVYNDFLLDDVYCVTLTELNRDGRDAMEDALELLDARPNDDSMIVAYYVVTPAPDSLELDLVVTLHRFCEFGQTVGVDPLTLGTPREERIAMRRHIARKSFQEDLDEDNIKRGEI